MAMPNPLNGNCTVQCKDIPGWFCSIRKSSAKNQTQLSRLPEVSPPLHLSHSPQSHVVQMSSNLSASHRSVGLLPRNLSQLGVANATIVATVVSSTQMTAVTTTHDAILFVLHFDGRSSSQTVCENLSKFRTNSSSASFSWLSVQTATESKDNIPRSSVAQRQIQQQSQTRRAQCSRVAFKKSLIFSISSGVVNNTTHRQQSKSLSAGHSEASRISQRPGSIRC